MKPVHKSNKLPLSRPYLELFILFGLVIVTSLSPFRQFKEVVSLLAVLYFFIERLVRKRSWKDVGFNPKTLCRDLLANWHLILVVVVGIQLLFVLLSKAFWPEVMAHILGRVPLDFTQLLPIILTLLVAALAEEVLFRGLFQGRLGQIIGVRLAILLTSVVFGISHIAPGVAIIVAVDVLFVTLDSIVYGCIFARSQNVLASWLAHFGANLMGVLLLIVLF